VADAAEASQSRFSWEKRYARLNSKAIQFLLRLVHCPEPRFSRASRAGSPVPVGSAAAGGKFESVQIKLRVAAHLQILALPERCESAKGLVQSNTLRVA